MRSWMKTALAAACWAAAGGALAAPAYRVVDKIPGPDGSWDYARVDSVSNRVLVAHGDSVMAIDLATRKVVSGLSPGARLHIALPVNGGAEMLVTNGGSDTVVFADAKTGAVNATIHTGASPDGAALDARSGLVLVMDHKGGDVVLLNVKTHERVGAIEIGGDLEEAAVDGAGRAFVNVESKNEIAVLDIAARKVVARYPLAGCDGPTGLAYDRKDKLLIAACDGVTVLVRASDGKIVKSLATGKGADGVAYDAKRRLAFVPAGRDGTLSIIALAHGTGSVVGTTPTARGARTIALDERSGRLYLPAADYVFPPGGGRPTITPGSFQVLVVAPAGG